MHILDPNLTKDKMDEYLRRNLVHASSVGANADANYILSELKKRKRPAKWLLKSIKGIIDRTEKVHHEMAKHRDEIEVYKEIK